jgi:hypothetical protein
MSKAGRKNKHHGEVGTHLHTAWASMKHRCYNPRMDSFQYYGGRGIEVFSERHEYPTFARQVRAEIGEHPGKGYQLDRINTDGNYEPGNIRWLTAKENTRNRRTCRMLRMAEPNALVHGQKSWE